MGNNRIFTLHAALSLILPLLAFIVPNLHFYVSLGIAFYALIFFSYFYFYNQIKPYKPADGITAFRLVIALVLLVTIPQDILSPVFVFFIIIFAEILDGLDGIIARKTGPTKFGAVWDMEIDAYFILILSFITVFYLNYPWWILGFGFMRYLFYFIFYFLKPEGAKFSKSLSHYSKTICVATVLLLALIWIIPIKTGLIMGFILLALLVISFLWESAFYISIRSKTRKR